MKIPITIITPSYNQAQYIEQTILSVLSQNYTNLEYMIIDGGSTDQSVEIIKKHKKHLSYWISEPDQGQSHAINKGLKHAQGDVINWLNSDDYYQPEALKRISEIFKDNHNGVGGVSRLFNHKGMINYSRGTDVYSGNLPKTIGWARTDQPETFFSKEAWDRVGLLNENLHFCMDREWWIRYLYEFGLDGFKKTNDVLVNFRIHDNSKTQTAQELFRKEHHSLYYQMSLVVGYKLATSFMSKNLEINTNLETQISTWTNKELTKLSFNYYLLKTADEYYANENWKLAKGFLDLVESRLLAKEDQKLFKKLSQRIRLPKTLIKLFRKG